MLKSYFKTAIRFLWKNKTFSLINIIGLAMGTLSCLYILLYVEEQYSYDRQEDQAGDIYRVTTSLKLLGDHRLMATVSPPVAAALKHDCPEVQQYTRVFNPRMFGADQHLLKYKDHSFFEKEAFFVDSTFFELFTYRFLRGNPSLALTEPYSIVLTSATAGKLFGREDPMGKVIRINNKAGGEDLKVTGIIDESLGRSHIRANAFITMNSGLIGRIVNRSIYSQLNYIKNKDLGFEKGQKLIFNIYTDGVNTSSLLADLRLLPEVKAATKTNSQLGKAILSDRSIYLAGGNTASGQDANIMVSDNYFARAAGLRLVRGRDFHDSDSGKVLINETLAQRLRLDPATAQGTKLYSKGDESVFTYEVVGIVKDFHYSSLHETVKPYMLICDPNSPSLCTLMINFNTANYKGLLAKIASIWQKDVAGVPFEYSFLDSEVQKQYETEITLSNIINCFTGMAILISCMGLFGLAAFSAEQRSKEIGVRKILGASVSGIVQLLSADFLKLVGIALLISIPISWWGAHKWLQEFAYKVDLHWWMFALSGLLAAAIAMITVSSQTIRAARANPVKSLKAD